MKTAISIPDSVFRRAEQLAKRRSLSRSALYTEAIREYLDRRIAADVTIQLNQVYADTPAELDPVLGFIQSLSLPCEEW